MPSDRAASLVVAPLIRHNTAQLRRRGGMAAKAASMAARVATWPAKSPLEALSPVSGSSRRKERRARRNPTRYT
jgi:hypothetical protein